MATTHPPDAMQCALCFQRHKDPKILNCFHTFCRECLEKLIFKRHYKQTFPCPLCATEIGIPKAGCKSLQDNYYIRAIQASAAFSTLSACDICKNEDMSAHSRCLECESNYCEICIIRHFASENSKEHHVIELSKPNAKSVTKLTHKQFCSKHKNEETNYYCMLCEIPVCKECVSKVSDHKGHRYKNISEGAKEKRELVKPVIRSMHEYLPVLQDYVNDMNSCKTLLGDYADQTTKEIKDRYNSLKDELDRICQTLVDEVENTKRDECSKIDKHLGELETTIRSISSTTTSAEDICNLANDSELVEICNKLLHRFKHVNNEIPSSGIISCLSSNFHEGTIEGKSWEDIFGYCDTTDIKMPILPIPWGLRMALTFDVQCLYKFKVSDSIDTIHAIAPVSDNKAWICCGWGTTKMSLYNKEGEKLKTATLSVQIDDICVKPNGEILVSSYDDKKIVKLDADLKQSDFVTLNWYPGGMTFTKKKELLVCAVDSYVTTRSSTSRRMVVRIRENGDVIDQIEDNGFNEVFCAPYRVYENMIGDLCVSDREENNVRVTSLALDGTIKHVYNGPKDIVTKKSFNPFGVVSDKYGHVIVSDWSNHALHLLDISGQFLGFLLTEKDGIRGPNALALDKEGLLWVGDTKSTIWIFKYNRKADTGHVQDSPSAGQ